MRGSRRGLDTRSAILDAARRLLVTGGTEKVTQRGIAAELGITAAALYRHFGSRELLLLELAQVLYWESSAQILAAGQVGTAGSALHRLRSAARGYRQWALDHRAEFGLLFGAPIPSLDRRPFPKAHWGSRKFFEAWLTLYMDVLGEAGVRHPADGKFSPSLGEQLEPLLDFTHGRISVDAAALFLSGWTRLYGAVAIEIFGHLEFAVEDGLPLFDQLMDELTDELGAGSLPN